MTNDINSLIRSHSLNGGRIRMEALPDKEKEIIYMHYDLVHDLIMPFWEVESEKELSDRVHKQFPALLENSISALLATIAYDYR